MTDSVLVSLHGREIGLNADGALVIRSGVIVSEDGSPVSFPDGIDGSAGIIEQVSKSTAYTLVLSDAGKHLYHPAADTTPRTWTIPANSSVAFEIGTVVTFVNDPSAGALTIACGDTLWLASDGTTGSRTLAAGGVATAIKVTATKWAISGAGLT